MWKKSPLFIELPLTGFNFWLNRKTYSVSTVEVDIPASDITVKLPLHTQPLFTVL